MKKLTLLVILSFFVFPIAHAETAMSDAYKEQLITLIKQEIAFLEQELQQQIAIEAQQNQQTQAMGTISSQLATVIQNTTPVVTSPPVQSPTNTSPVFSLLSQPTINATGQNVTGSSPSTSTITASFNISLKTQGSVVYINSNPFLFKIFDGQGSDVTTSLMGVSQSLSITKQPAWPASPINLSTGVSPNTTVGLTGSVSFGGKDNLGNPLYGGPYFIEVDGINYSTTLSGSPITFPTDSLWKTSGVNAP